MTLKDRIATFSKLFDFLYTVAEEKRDLVEKKLVEKYDQLNELIKKLNIYNGWFTEEFVRYQLKSVSNSAKKEKIEEWINPYEEKINNTIPSKVGVVMAGNIPFVGFHDFISVLICGHNFIGKLSSKDEHLPKKIAEILIKIEPDFENKIEFTTEKITDFDAVIATGSNNSSRYFKYYFSKVHNIIRSARNSVAILDGSESEKDLEKLADDVFLFFGLGCRNVSKIFIPVNFKIDRIFEAFYKYKDLIYNNKYANNFDYNRAVYLMNKIKFLENGFVILKEDFSIPTPVSVVNYEFYEKIENVEKNINTNSSAIQCVSTNIENLKIKTVKLGETQNPQLTDYEDGINTIEFLTKL